MKPYKFPFRVGRKQRRAVLDAEGREIVVFPKGCEDMAIEFATFKNTMEAERLKALNGNGNISSSTITPQPLNVKDRSYDSKEWNAISKFMLELHNINARPSRFWRPR